MRRYLNTLHQRSESHRKRFALIVSGSATLVILAVWSLVNFGTEDAFAKNAPATVRASAEVSPLNSLREGFADTLAGVREALGGIKGTLEEAVDMEADYKEMKGGVLNTYGQ